MKQLIPSGLLFLYLVASTELHQFFYLPTLVDHYLEHRTENPKLNLAGFMMNHYFSGDTSPDYARHQSLPFKNHKCPEVNITIALPPDDVNTVVPHDYFLRINQIPHEALGTKHPCHFSVWQPPRA